MTYREKIHVLYDPRAERRRVSQTEKMDHALRDYTRSQLESHLNSGVMARNCERSILNWTVKKFPKCQASWANATFMTTYKHKVHSLLAEFKRSSQLADRLKSKELESAKLASYSPDVLWPDGPYSKALFKAREKDMMFEEIRAKDDDYEGLLKCGKCKSTKTDYTTMQTRSADGAFYFRLLRLLLTDASV